MNHHNSGGSTAKKLPPRIVLRPHEGLWHYRPLELPDAPLTPFPRLPISLIHQACDWLRHVWHDHERVGCVLIYLDVCHHRWAMDVPPQVASRFDFRCDLGYGGVQVPDRNHLLCASISSNPSDNWDDVVAGVPAFEGFHFVQHVQHELLAACMFFRTGEDLVEVPPQQAIELPVDPNWNAWDQRTRQRNSI